MPARPLIAALLAVALAASAAGCGDGSEDEVAAPVTTATTSSTTTTTRPVVRQPCTPANLAAAVAAADYPDPAVLDQACSSTWAVATVRSDRIPGGEGVGYFQNGPDGAWSLVKIGSTEADQLADAPEELPDTIVVAWRRNFDARLRAERNDAERQEEPPPPPSDGEGGAGGVVNEEPLAQ
jgi:hypothetical protein